MAALANVALALTLGALALIVYAESLKRGEPCTTQPRGRGRAAPLADGAAGKD